VTGLQRRHAVELHAALGARSLRRLLIGTLSVAKTGTAGDLLTLRDGDGRIAEDYDALPIETAKLRP
jgi:hypothetical protein